MALADYYEMTDISRSATGIGRATYRALVIDKVTGAAPFCVFPPSDKATGERIKIDYSCTDVGRFLDDCEFPEPEDRAALCGLAKNRSH